MASKGFTAINMDMANEATETHSETIEELLKRAEELMAVGSREAGEKVQELLNKMIEKDPLNAEVVTTLGMSLLYSGNAKNSIGIFESALRIDPTLKRAKILKENAQKLQKILEKTEFIETTAPSSLAGQMEILEDGLKIDPINRNVMDTLLYRQALGFYNQQQYNNALKNISELFESYPVDDYDHKLYYLRARCYVKLSMPFEASLELVQAEKGTHTEAVVSEIKQMKKAITKALAEVNHYNTLGITSFASAAQIELAYKNLTLCYKIEVCRDQSRDPQFIRKVQLKFKRVEEAYAVLSSKLGLEEFKGFQKMPRDKRIRFLLAYMLTLFIVLTLMLAFFFIAETTGLHPVPNYPNRLNSTCLGIDQFDHSQLPAGSGLILG